MVGRHAAARSSRRWIRSLWVWSASAAVLIGAVAMLIDLDHGRHVATAATDTTTTGVVATTTTTQPPTVSLSAVGDTELGNIPDLPPSPSTYLAPVKAALAAPIVFGNLEGTMTEATSSKCGSSSSDCYAFRVPPSYARLYRAAGFNVLNSANNHSYDFGSQGVSDTSAALQSAGITQAGLPGQIGVVGDGFLKVAFVDFAPYSLTNNLLNSTAATQLIAKAHRLADVVVVYMHAGAEGADADHVTRTTETFVGEDRGNPYAFAHAAIDEGADLVIASGPHVLRGMEFYRGHLIDYSLGDFANYDNFAASGVLDLSAILHVTLTSSGGFVSASLTSVRLDSSGRAFVDPTQGARDFINTLSREDFGASAAVIAADGTISAAS